VSVTVGQQLTLEVSKIVHGGFGIGRVDGQVVFVQGTLPDEAVRVVVTDVRKSHAFADLIEVVSPSPHRQTHVWPEADVLRPPEARVGGADYGHISLPIQRDLKASIIDEALRRQGTFSDGFPGGVVVESVPGSPDGLAWRTRVTLHVDDSGVAGQRAFHSHRVIQTDSLPLASPEIEALGAHQTLWHGASEVRLGVTSIGETWMESDIDNSTTRVVREVVAGIEFFLDTASFWQVHRAAASTLFSAVQQALDMSLLEPEAENLDLYGGVGLFAAALATRGGDKTRVTSVESHQQASQFASQNLSRWGHAGAVASDVKRYLARQVRVADEVTRGRLQPATVVLDPPRSGAGSEVIAPLVSLSPAQIVYVACDPVAFARDQKLLAEAGYELHSLRAFDLFPHTHHVEMVAGFSR
jgi:tRNA/tmRNA/rRNA uracil-C5-methylase (TrmA/RlmC/RlmD family)